MLVQYLRKENRVPVGVVVALDKEHFGWSLCNKHDIFDRKLGLKIATNRAMIGSHVQIPFTLEEVYFNVYQRAQKYFK